MIQEIVATRTEIIDIHRPSLVGQGDAKLILRVPLSQQRDKLLWDCGIIRVVYNCEQRAADCDEGRRLIELTVETSQYPVEAWESKRHSGSGASAVFCDGRGREVRLSNAAAQRQPWRDGELVFHENCFHVSRYDLSICKGCIRAIVEQDANELDVELPKPVEAAMDGGTSHGYASHGLRLNITVSQVISTRIQELVL